MWDGWGSINISDRADALSDSKTKNTYGNSLYA